VIYVGARDGSIPLKTFGELQLVEDHLSWSPDCGAIAYTSSKSGSWDVWILDTHKGKSVRITTHPAKDQRPYWHPSGKKIFFLSYRSLQPDLWEFNILTGKAKQLTRDDLEENGLTMSRDGNRLAFRATDLEGASDLVFLDVTTRNRITLAARSRNIG